MTGSINHHGSPSVFTMALAQSLALLSLRFPRLNGTVGLVVILLVPLLPLVAAVACYFAGYWIVAIVLAVLCFIIIMTGLYMANATLQNLQPPSPQAIRALQYRANQTRVKRFKAFDLYKPPGTAVTSVKCALLLIPETLVDCASYAEIASKLSDKGVMVVVQNTNPYRMSSTLVGSSLANLQGVIQDVEKMYSIKEWAIGGHGIGTRPAAVLVEELKMTKLVFWGAYSLNQDLSLSSLNVLVVMASKDGYFTSKSKDDIAQFRSRLPPDAAGSAIESDTTTTGSTTIYCMITGGNHSGFATCSETSSSSLREDGERDIRLEEQHKTCVNTTAMFLLHSQKSFRYQQMNDEKEEEEQEAEEE